MVATVVASVRVSARRFHSLPLPNRISRNYCESNSIIASAPAASVGQNSGIAATQILSCGSKLDAYALVHLTRACAGTAQFSDGEQLHCLILKSGFNSDVFVSTALVGFYVKCERLSDAYQLFDEIREPSVVSWNALISGLVRSGQFRKALKLFVQLEDSNLCADSYSFTAALSACGQLSLVQVGRSVHSKIVKYGAECSVYVSNCLIDMYGKCGYAAEAMQVFRGMVEKDTISWNSILSATARNGNLERAFAVFRQMPDPDTISYNELIDGVARFGVIDDAVALLSKVPNPTSSSWNSIATGYVNRGRGREALEFFCKMHTCGAGMDEFTFSTILSGIASLSAITWGNVTHCCVLRRGFDGYVVVGSALIDMYLKCGKIEEAERLFQWLPGKNLVTWNAMISGYAHNGNSRKVMELFENLKRLKDLQPDEITFLNVISACCHSRLPLKVTRHYLKMMIDDYRIDPNPEHCSILIRAMGQEGGDASEAEKLIKKLGYDSCGMVWKTLLGSCVTGGNLQVAELAAKKVMELEGYSDYVYVMMSNVYAWQGKWEEVSDMRKSMKERGVRKETGCSWVEVEVEDAIIQNTVM